MKTEVVLKFDEETGCYTSKGFNENRSCIEISLEAMEFTANYTV